MVSKVRSQLLQRTLPQSSILPLRATRAWNVQNVLKRISLRLTTKNHKKYCGRSETHYQHVVVSCWSLNPSYLLHLLMLPALTPNARRDPWHTQMWPSPRSVHPVASAARCNANEAPGSRVLDTECQDLFPMVDVDPTCCHALARSNAPHTAVINFTSGGKGLASRQKKQWKSRFAQHTEMRNDTIQIDVASLMMVVMSSDHMSFRNMSKVTTLWMIRYIETYGN